MKSVRNLLLGLLSIAASSLIVLGGLSLALLEGQMPFSPSPIPPTQTSTRATEVVLEPELVTRQPSPSPVVVTATSTATPLCPPPKGWQPYVLQADDSYEEIAAARDTTVQKLVEANCLPGPIIMEGSILYIPPTKEPKPTKPPEKPEPEEADTATPVPPTQVPCGVPPNWVPYTVRSGDTLSRLAREFDTSVYTLQVANCLLGTDLIYAGQVLYVPYKPSKTPTRTATQPPEPTHTRQPSATRDLAATRAWLTAQSAEQTQQAQQKTQQSQQETAIAQQKTNAAAISASETASAIETAQVGTLSAQQTSQSATETAQAALPPEGSLPSHPGSGRWLSWLLVWFGAAMWVIRRLV